MQKIKRLPLQEIQKIAAGQVVERPANVVKELIENALDAGATTIALYCIAAGQKLIRVVDNGCGMSELDATLCFERHATSKLDSFEQLSTISTFGFRGEALYTIGAVSSVTLLTKESENTEGTKIYFNQGVLETIQSASSAQGTDISVADLFANVPARKKFLKKEETEWRVIVQLFQAFCFSHLNVHFQLYSDEKLVYNCPSVTTVHDRCMQLWDMHTANNLLTVESEEATIKNCIISQPHYFCYNKNNIFFFVNKRWVKNYELTHAILKGYCNVLPPMRYPVAILDIEIDPLLVDSNIHPRKEEIKFVHPKMVEHALTACIKKGLEKKVSIQLHSATFKEEQQHAPSVSPMSLAHPLEQKIFMQKQDFSMPFAAFDPVPQTKPTATYTYAFENKKNVSELSDTQQQKIQDQTELFNVVGVYNKTYILLEHEDGLLVIDQHAAHERILFEQFSAKLAEVASIRLLFPESLYFIARDIDLLMQHSLLLAEHGIHYDRMGESHIVIKAIPVHLKSVQWAAFFQEILDIFLEYAQLEKEDFFAQVNKKLQAQMACKAAVKAGDVLTHEQIQKLLTDLNVLENRLTCPHGRPTSWLLPLLEIEKKFKRKK